MSELFKVLPEEVINSLKRMKSKIKEINELRNNLYSAIEVYKNNFQDEISKESSDLVKRIDEELEALDQAFIEFMSNKEDIMNEIEEWRTY